jgi:hypothetical protein
VNVSRPGPGSPATLLTEASPVGAMQNTAPSTGCEVSRTGGSSTPFAISVLVPAMVLKPPVKKHGRLVAWQVPGAHSAFEVQPRCACGNVHVVMIGPVKHSPSPSTGAVSTQWGGGLVESSMHA